MAQTGPARRAKERRPYGAAPVAAEVDLEDRYRLLIGGRFRAPRSQAWEQSRNPATGRPLAEIACAGAADVEAAIAAAAAARRGWRRRRAKDRAAVLFAIAARIEQDGDELAALEALDAGTPIRAALGADVPRAARAFFSAAACCAKLEHLLPGCPHRPLGACAVVAGHDGPLLAAAGPLAAALAVGNTCLLHPARTAPLSALRLAGIMTEVGLPPGVVNVLTGGPAVARALAADRRLAAVTFSGSTEAARELAASVAAAGRRVLGAEEAGPHLLFEDASLEQAIEGIAGGAATARGPGQFAGARVLVQESILEPALARLEARLGTIRVGDPLDLNTDRGPMASAARVTAVRRRLDEAAAEGVAVRPCPLPGGLGGRGCWLAPCLLAGVQPAHTIARGPISGPVLVVQSFRTTAEAVAAANGGPSPPGPVTVWTDKASKLNALARRLRASLVWCNASAAADRAAPSACEGGGRALRSYLAG